MFRWKRLRFLYMFLFHFCNLAGFSYVFLSLFLMKFDVIFPVSRVERWRRDLRCFSSLTKKNGGKKLRIYSFSSLFFFIVSSLFLKNSLEKCESFVFLAFHYHISSVIVSFHHLCTYLFVTRSVNPTVNSLRALFGFSPYFLHLNTCMYAVKDIVWLGVQIETVWEFAEFYLSFWIKDIIWFYLDVLVIGVNA